MFMSLAAMAMIGWCSGCGRKPAAPPPPPDTSFQRIMSNVDSGGDLLVVANLEGILQQCVETVSQDLASIAAADRRTQPAADTAKRVNAFLQKNGFYAARGYGLSVVPRTKEVNAVKLFLARDPAAADLPLWRCLVGGKPSVHNSLYFLPADTVMVNAGSEDMSQLWRLIESGVSDIAAPDIAASFQMLMAAMSMQTGVEINRVFQSLGEGGFVSVQLSRNNTVNLPLGSKPLAIAEPSLLIALAVKDDTILKLLDAQLAKAGMPIVTKQVGEASLHSMSVSLPTPIAVQPTYTMHAGHLLLGSSEKAVTDAMTAFKQHNGLLATPEFAKAFEGLSMTNNGLVYYSPRFVAFVNDLQRGIMATAATATPGESATDGITQAFMRSLTRLNNVPTCSFVTVNTEQGILTTGSSSTDGKMLVLQMCMAPVGMMAAIAIPSFMKARTTSQQNACINNLRVLESAKDQLAIEAGKTNGAAVTMKDLAPYLKHSQGVICPAGGSYKLNTIGVNPICTQPGHRLP